MIRSLRTASLLSLISASALLAQGQPPQGQPPQGPPAARMGRPMGGPPAAQMLLSNVGQLELTDAQVVRLAAIARRSEARRRSMMSAMDSARTRFTQPGDSVARRQFRQRMENEMRRAEEQSQTDQRDAIAVLTPDQQAKAWTMVANRGRPGRGAMQRGVGERRMAPRDGRPMREPGNRPEMRGRMRGDEFAPPLRRGPGRRPEGDRSGTTSE